MKIGVIVNTNAGNGKGIDELIESNLPVDFYKTRTLADLDRAADKLKEYDTIAIYGGDGTLHKTLTKLILRYNGNIPNIAILGGGTMNTTKDGIGVKGSANSILERIIKGEGVVVERSILEITDLENKKKEYGFICGSGLVYSAVKEYTESRKGVAEVISVAIKLLISCFGPCSKDIADVYVNENRLVQSKYSVILASTIKNISLGLEIAYKANGERFHLIASQSTGLDLIKDAFNLLCGKEPKKAAFSDLTNNAVIKSNFLKYVIDGELKKAKEGICIKEWPNIRFLL